MDVLMPQLGETVAEGKVTTWFKSVGDTVKQGENLFEIETDKVSMEIQAIAGGVLSEIKVNVGEVAKVGAVVAIIGDGASGASPAPVAAKATSAPQAAAAPAAPPATVKPASVPAPATRAAPVAAAAPSGPIVLDPYREVRTPTKDYGAAKANGRAITPLARRLAAEAGIDVSKLSGTGPRGRVVAADVRSAPRASTAGAALATGLGAAEVMALYKSVPFEEVPLDGMRKTIASRLQVAKQTVPHFYLVGDVTVDALIRVREELNAGAPRGKDGTAAYKLSLNDFIVKAWAVALQTVPAANAVWAGDRILRFARADVAVAVAIDGGLITPVVRSADSKSVKTISAEVRDLAARARVRKLMPEEYQGGASAVSNLGMYGVREFSAIINPPHGTILAVGATRRQAVEQADGSAKFESVMTVTLSCDHRVVDGALGAELLAAFKAIVEAPLRILL
jgi:pyruvate dehydrogenase E2 component (dihydrolipoamide acetyltransferase)